MVLVALKGQTEEEEGRVRGRMEVMVPCVARAMGRVMILCVRVLSMMVFGRGMRLSSFSAITAIGVVVGFVACCESISPWSVGDRVRTIVPFILTLPVR